MQIQLGNLCEWSVFGCGWYYPLGSSGATSLQKSLQSILLLEFDFMMLIGTLWGIAVLLRHLDIGVLAIMVWIFRIGGFVGRFVVLNICCLLCCSCIVNLQLLCFVLVSSFGLRLHLSTVCLICSRNHKCVEVVLHVWLVSFTRKSHLFTIFAFLFLGFDFVLFSGQCFELVAC